ncbi:MAG: hypothetical protein U0228_19840 [Myxococcaceae bacterium]
MKRIVVPVFCCLLAACAKEREAAIAVTVTFEQGTQSTHVVVTAKGGDVMHSTKCMAVDGQRVLDVAVAQGDLPDTIMLSAEGFSDDACAQPTDPIENAVAIEKKFRRGLILDAALLLRAVRPSIEVNCANGLDDDADGQKDCADLDCTDRACSTGNACIEGQTCSNGTCQGGRQVQCSTPPSGCFSVSGLCVVDAGCRYAPMPGTMCNDGSDCTQNDRCDTTGGCTGTPMACTNPPPGPCWKAAGACAIDAGCLYDPDVGASCNDSDNCTTTDSCLADGGCGGTRVSCPARECAVPTGSCTADGGCLYAPLDAGLACGTGGACNTQGGCLPSFPFVPSNVAINDVPTPSSGKVTFNCGTTTIDSSGTSPPAITNACPGQPAFGSALITQNGGLSTLVLSFQDLEVSGGSKLVFTGTRPVIVISMTNINVLGAIEAGAGAQPCVGTGAGNNGSGPLFFRSGGGGGGFASAGANGGNISSGASGGSGGAINIGTALRGGCPGGIGGGSSERASSGGGALQLVALNSITIGAPISAPGAGGKGGGFGNGGNGGGSGGDLLLEAQQIIASSGSITANGGGGGEAGTGNAGQSGQLSATPATGGTDGLLGGAGGAGAAGSTNATDGENGGGGGGGGVGRIRFNVTNSCNLGVQVDISPPATSNRPDAGCP